MSVWQTAKRSLSWVRIAFTFGNVSEVNPDEEMDTVRGVKFDGMISALLMFFVTIVISSTLTFTSFASNYFDDNICLVTLIAYMVVGMTVMLIFSVNRKKVLLSSSVTAPEETRRDNLTLIGMTVLYVFASLLDIFHIISYVRCDEFWRNCQGRYIYFSYIVEVVYHVARISYLGGETFLCISFNRSVFSHKPLTRYGLMFLQSVNFSLWFDAFVHESSRRFSTRLHRNEDSTACRPNRSNLTEHDLDCMHHNGTLNVLIEDSLSPIFLPFMIEFTLLVGESFSHWYFHTDRTSTERRSEYRENDADQTDDGTEADDGNQDGGAEELKSVQEYDPDDSQLDDSGSFSFTDSDEPPIEQEDSVMEDIGETNSHQTGVLKYLLWFLVFLAVNVPVFVLAIHQRFVTGEGFSVSKRLLMYYLVGQAVCMTAVVVVGYLVSSEFKVTKRTPFSVLECMLLLSTCGPLLARFLSMIAIAELRHSVNETSFTDHFLLSPSVYVIAELISAFEVCLEVVFNLFSARVIVACHDTTWRALLFRLTILYLGAANFSLWLFSNAMTVPLEFEIFSGYFSNYGWLCIEKVALFFPVSMFFRFISALQFFRVFQRLLDDDGT